MQYVGQNGRSLKIRFGEHYANIMVYLKRLDRLFSFLYSTVDSTNETLVQPARKIT